VRSLLSYYLRLALKSVMHTPVLSTLTIATIALGIAACTITLTLLYLMSADPIAHKSAQLYRVQLDSWDPNMAAIEPNLPPEDVTWTDATNIVAADQAYRQTASAITWGMVNPLGQDTLPFLAQMRVTHGDFFPMFAAPFLYGGGWNRQADQNGQLVAVLSKATNDRVFNGENSVGRTLPMLGKTFTVVGVLNNWHPSPKFYDMAYGAFSDPEDIYLPFRLKADLELPHGGQTSCWQPIESDQYDTFLHSECTNFQLWVELRNPAEKAAFNDYLQGYVEQQKKLGRFARPINNRLSNVTQWLSYKQVVQADVRVMFWLSVMFLLVCLLNAISLLSAKLNTKTLEIGLRRALGASYRQIVSQYLLEIMCLGLAGGLCGLLLALLGLQGVKQLYAGYGQLVQLDLVLTLSVMLLAVISTLVAGLFPVVSACRPAPAFQLKQP
jgi:putative ABC transport system permease protein